MALILALCILFPKISNSMADVAVWGLLPKAQDDATTIDGAINAAVAAHNDDPTAHMAAGQSIDVHRTNDILDHPAGSVLADKRPFASLELATNFETLTGFTITGLITRFWPGLFINVYTSAHTDAEIGNDTSGFILYPFNFAQLPFFQIAQQLGGSNSGTIWFGLGSKYDTGDYQFFGFKFVGDAMYGVVNVFGSIHTVSLGTNDEFEHLFRCYVDPDTHDAIFLMDGVQIGSIPAVTYWSAASVAGQNDQLFSFGAHATNGSGYQYYLASFLTGNNLP